MTERIKRRISALVLTLVMAIGLLPALTPTAYADAITNISLVAATSYVFDPATEGYSTQPFYSVRVQNTGATATGALNITLSGTHADKFTLSSDSISDIAAGNEQSFSVVYKAGLSAGTYTATVTVAGTNVVSKSFDISFTVQPAGTTYAVQICTNIDGVASNMVGDIELHKDTDVIAIPNTGTGIYEKAIPNGSYFIYINGVNTGRTLAVNNSTCSITLDYFTVSFSATKAGTTADVNVGASVGGVAISSGDIVLSGKAVAITASGTGAGSYTYAWSGASTSGQTTETLNITLSGTVDATCVVTGTGTTLLAPDYEINGAGYNWTGTDQTIILSGANDTLSIHKEPAANIKLEVHSVDGSTVTIDGNSVECASTTVVVSNAITLNLTNFSITAPTGDLQDWHLLTGLLLKKSTTINVSGTCNIVGNSNTSKPWYGHGIASEQDNTLSLTGSGTLNATGGSAHTGNGGAGITVITHTYGTESGSKLIIDGGVTVNAKGGDSPDNQAGYGILAGWGDVTIDHAVVSAIGGAATGNSGDGGMGIQAVSSNDVLKCGTITVTDSTVTAEGGVSAMSNGGIGIYASTDVKITGGEVTSTGGSGHVNGAHGVFSNRGVITVENGTNLTAVGGNGATGVGGVGVRAYGSADSVSPVPGMATIAKTANNICIRGGQGATAPRASVMGKAVYIGTGNIGPIEMESGIARSIKNTPSGDDVYLVTVTTNPADTVEIQCAVNGALGGSYTYRAVATADGKACLWLPEGARTLSATGYEGGDLTIVTNDTSNTVALSKPSVVTAHDSAELSTYMAATYVTTINLVSGTEYTYGGTTVNRALAINGNGATIKVGTGINDTIVKKEGNTVDGKVFLAVQSGSLTIKNVTLQDVSTRILAALNVKTDGTLLLDGVIFKDFFANLSTDAYPGVSNIPGSYNNFGVHAEPGAVSITVKNCTFGSSNTFRNAIAIRNGTAIITDNTFVGTATPARQNQTDGFEYAVYLYGGTCTVTGNDISGYDSILKSLGYHSAGISTCPYYSLSATITGNRLYDNARGIDGVGAWHTYSDPASVTINGTVLATSEDAFTIGQVLKTANTFSGNTDGDIALILDQNDNYIDVKTGVEYGPPAYFEPLLKVNGTNSMGASLGFETGTWAHAMVINAKSIGLEVSEDNGTTWKAASISGTLNSSSTGVTVNLAAGKTYLLRTVITITANTRPVGSLGNVSADITSYSNTVSVTISSGGGSTSGASGGAAVIVNGESKTAGTAQTTTDPDGKTVTTVTVDSGKLESVLAATESGAMVIIPVAGKSDVSAGVLTGEMVKSMENREATLVVKTDSSTYTLPAAEINITAVSQQLGTTVALKDITVTVSLSAPSSQMSETVENAAKEGGFTTVLQAVDYTVTCSYGGRTINVSCFNAYVERTVAIPSGVDPSKITTGIVVKPDGTTYHVPTRVTIIDGKYYAVINSLTNSTYSVVWNPVVFSDVSNHWAKASVNNMGSRMVVEGVGSGNFEPDRNMTRAEFAAVMVRALGLEPGIGTSSFADVAPTEWYCGYVKTASTYGVIKGYSEVAFGPDDKITREQAMTMIARAMKITGLNAGLTDGEGGKLIVAYTDGAAVSSFANDGVAECIKTGVVSGRENNMLAPKAYITRAEIAVIIERLLQKSNLI